jgi:hypothetical protein
MEEEGKMGGGEGREGEEERGKRERRGEERRERRKRKEKVRVPLQCGCMRACKNLQVKERRNAERGSTCSSIGPTFSSMYYMRNKKEKYDK